MTAADWHDVTFTVCVIAVMFAIAIIVAWGTGWIEGSLSLRIVPPWKRRPAEPRAKAVPAQQSPVAPVPLDQRRAG